MTDWGLLILTELLGWIGSIMLAVCALPAAYSAWKDKRCQYDKLFILIWFWGEVVLLGYALLTKQWLLVPNYCVNILSIAIIWRYNEQ